MWLGLAQPPPANPQLNSQASSARGGGGGAGMAAANQLAKQFLTAWHRLAFVASGAGMAPPQSFVRGAAAAVVSLHKT
jgi:hypothetical protein